MVKEHTALVIIARQCLLQNMVSETNLSFLNVYRLIFLQNNVQKWLFYDDTILDKQASLISKITTAIPKHNFTVINDVVYVVYPWNTFAGSACE